MNTKALLGTALVLSLAWLTPTADADTYMKQERRTDPFTVMGRTQPAKTETIETWLSEQASRVQNADGTATLVVFADQRAYLINDAKRTYAELPMNLDEAIGEAIPEEEAQDEESKAAMAAMRGMAAQMMKFETSVTDTGEQRKIGDWQCRKYLLTTQMGMGTSTSEIWATEDLHADFSGYWKAANATMGGQEGFGTMLQEMSKIRGVVVLTVSHAQVMGSEVKTTEELLEFADKPAPAGTFELPAGYREVDLMGAQ